MRTRETSACICVTLWLSQEGGEGIRASIFPRPPPPPFEAIISREEVQASERREGKKGRGRKKNLMMTTRHITYWDDTGHLFTFCWCWCSCRRKGQNKSLIFHDRRCKQEKDRVSSFLFFLAGHYYHYYYARISKACRDKLEE